MSTKTIVEILPNRVPPEAVLDLAIDHDGGWAIDRRGHRVMTWAAYMAHIERHWPEALVRRAACPTCGR